MKTVIGRFDVGPYPCRCALHAGSTMTATVEVEVDGAALARLLGGRAMHNRGRQAVEAGGRIVVRVVE